jgi:hypothetical protein
MPSQDIATLKLTVDPDALKKIISEGRLMEFSAAVASSAAAQINAELVKHVAEATHVAEAASARSGQGLSVNIAYRSVVIDGEPGFGTHPPGPPRPPVVKFEF